MKDLFDTDPDLTGFDVDVSPYVRDADDTDVRVFWRDLSVVEDDPLRPRREELCAVSIGAARTWISKLRTRSKGKSLVFQRDPQWRRRDGRTGTAPPGWSPLHGQPWPGLILLADLNAGGYRESVGFTGDPKNVPAAVADSAESIDVSPAPAPQGSDSLPSGETDGHWPGGGRRGERVGFADAEIGRPHRLDLILFSDGRVIPACLARSGA